MFCILPKSILFDQPLPTYGSFIRPHKNHIRYRLCVRATSKLSAYRIPTKHTWTRTNGRAYQIVNNKIFTNSTQFFFFLIQYHVEISTNAQYLSSCDDITHKRFAEGSSEQVNILSSRSNAFSLKPSCLAA